MAETKDENASIDLAAQPLAEDIKNLILTIRGRQVLLDSDVARLYGYDTRRINETAKRNEDRFPDRYRFQLTMEEAEEIRSMSQFATLNTGRGQNIKKLPWAYSEHGVSMLAGLLRNPIAVQVSLRIIDAFVELRQFISANRDVFANIANINLRLLEHDDKLIGQGEGVATVVITSSPSKLSKQCLETFGKQYEPIQVVKSNDFHDRFIILDDTDVYVFGASIKDAGNKCFGVFKNEDSGRTVAYVNAIISG
jgi:hypothetical protein